MEPSFYAVIPATVRYHKDLSDGAKLLYGEITALCNKMGYCWATNEYFSKLYDCSERTISRWISSLAKAGFLLTIVDKDDANSRKIWLPESQKVNQDYGQKRPDPIDKNVYTYGQKRPDPIDKNVYNNNTVNNTLNNTIEGKADKPQPTQPNEDQPDQPLNENPKKAKNFNGGGAAKNSDGGQILEVVNFLNDTVKPACNFRTASKTTASHIRQRIAEGFTVSDICIVIEHKNSQWKNDAKMSEYLRPATLFGTGKFEAYLVAARTWEKSGKRSAANSVDNQNQRAGLNKFGSDQAKYQETQIF